MKQSTSLLKDSLLKLSEALITYETTYQNHRNSIAINEMTYAEIFMLIAEIKNDVSFLIKSDFFEKITTYIDRQNLLNYINTIINHLSSNQLQYIFDSANSAKNLIRQLMAYKSKDAFSAWKSKLSELENSYQNLETTTQKTTKLLSETVEIHTQIKSKEQDFNLTLSELKTVYEKLQTMVSFLEGKSSNLDGLIKDSEGKNELINVFLSEVKENGKIIENFSKQISSRENQLQDQEVKTEEYTKKIQEFEKERQESLIESEKLIERATQALGYTTAAGLSSAITKQYEDSKSKWNTLPWLGCALALVASAVGIGILLLFAESLSTLIIGRIALLPVVLVGAWFCASQYTKQKQIIEDYAYKKVLVQSFIGFSEQLKNPEKFNEEYTHYIKTVLKEIHQNPLRNFKKSDGIEKLLDLPTEQLKDLLNYIKK